MLRLIGLKALWSEERLDDLPSSEMLLSGIKTRDQVQQGAYWVGLMISKVFEPVEFSRMYLDRLRRALRLA